MTPKEIMARNPSDMLRDKYSGATFRASELQPLLVCMLNDDAAQAREFAERFEVMQGSGGVE